jgi:hypothetical protein
MPRFAKVLPAASTCADGLRPDRDRWTGAAEHLRHGMLDDESLTIMSSQKIEKYLLIMFGNTVKVQVSKIYFSTKSIQNY